jgi:single-strand DNA-binding protein
MFAANIVVLRGRVTSEAIVRELPSGSSVTQFEITTRTGDANATVPVAITDRVIEFPVGTDVLVSGSVRRRFFRSGGVTQSRTEVVAVEIVRLSQKRAVSKILESVSALLAG